MSPNRKRRRPPPPKASCATIDAMQSFPLDKKSIDTGLKRIRIISVVLPLAFKPVPSRPAKQGRHGEREPSHFDVSSLPPPTLSARTLKSIRQLRVLLRERIWTAYTAPSSHFKRLY
ncbi:Hypothetical predicted protein [Podarcis lilfordi]|uniref:Uncharacterized protein n=1 Tax=Podarcis lilfordi TaxID=74358 RepID=A0AA35NYG7_9SAUR|nr:Hypothetical predicted protein [Podarcis lilfordi]